MNEVQAYDEAYLSSMIKLHCLLFSKINELDYDTCTIIDLYMRTSVIRSKMDKGNWSALNKGYKQLLNDIDYSQYNPETNIQKLDMVMLHWIANIYVLLQWKYNISSKEISERLPCKELMNLFSPMHEISEKRACEKFYHLYFCREVKNIIR